MEGAFSLRMSALVLAGLATTSTCMGTTHTGAQLVGTQSFDRGVGLGAEGREGRARRAAQWAFAGGTQRPARQMQESLEQDMPFHGPAGLAGCCAHGPWQPVPTVRHSGGGARGRESLPAGCPTLQPGLAPFSRAEAWAL